MKRITPLRLILCLGLFTLAQAVWADGTITHLSGPASIKKLDGRVVPAVAGGKVMTGETLVTGDKGYIRMELPDGQEMVLRPDSELKIEAYRFNKDKPEEDSSVFSMFKGGLRKLTGAIGKRGNQDAYQLKTPTATIGIRGTQFDLRVCQGNCGALADGTYAAVRFGAILASNPQGSQTVPAGKVVHVPPQRPPVILPRDPGVGFTPPPVIPKVEQKKQQEPAKTESSPTTQPQVVSENRAPAGSDQSTQTTQPAASDSNQSQNTQTPQCSVQ